MNEPASWGLLAVCVGWLGKTALELARNRKATAANTALHCSAEVLAIMRQTLTILQQLTVIQTKLSDEQIRQGRVLSVISAKQGIREE